MNVFWLAVLLAFSTNIWAEARFYFGVGLGDYESSSSLDRAEAGFAGSNTFDTGSFDLRLGVQLSDFYSLEARLGKGSGSTNTGTVAPGFVAVDSNDNTVANAGEAVSLEVEIDNYASIYFKPHLQFKQVWLYGRLGVSTVKATSKVTNLATSASGSNSANETSFAYGLGASIDLTEQWALAAEYNVLYDKRDTKVDGLSLALYYRF